MQNFLPGLALIIFMALLVLIIRLTVAQEKNYTAAVDEASVLSKYHAFLIVNVVLIYVLGSAIFAELRSIVEQPTQLPSLLGNSIPKQAFFFMNYIMLLSMGGFIMSLWRIVPFILGRVFRKFLAKTPRAIAATFAGGAYQYDVFGAKHLLILTLNLLYATITPMLLLFGLIYFALAYVATKYNLIFVHRNAYDTRGATFPGIVRRVVFALVFSQLMMLGVLGLKAFPFSVLGLVVVAVSFLWVFQSLLPELKNTIVLMPPHYDCDSSAAQLTSLSALQAMYIPPAAVENSDELAEQFEVEGCDAVTRPARLLAAPRQTLAARDFVLQEESVEHMPRVVELGPELPADETAAAEAAAAAGDGSAASIEGNERRRSKGTGRRKSSKK